MLLSTAFVADCSEAMTDNKARTASTVKNVIGSSGGSLSRVLFQFQKKGVISIKDENKGFDDILEDVVGDDIEDIYEEEHGVIKVSQNGSCSEI